jgi:hypothetical protein
MKRPSTQANAGETACATKANQPPARCGGAGIQPAVAFFSSLLTNRGLYYLRDARSLIVRPLRTFGGGGPRTRPRSRRRPRASRKHERGWRAESPPQAGGLPHTAAEPHPNLSQAVKISGSGSPYKAVHAVFCF